MEKITKEILKEAFPERPKEKYFKKYDFGLLIVIGGSDFYSGSPALAAMAAFRSGVGWSGSLLQRGQQISLPLFLQI
jgi:NAD(P)H-hydrate epimerase